MECAIPSIHRHRLNSQKIALYATSFASFADRPFGNYKGISLGPAVDNDSRSLLPIMRRTQCLRPLQDAGGLHPQAISVV